jgi:hypothetical protein
MLIAMRIMRQARRASDLLQPAFFVFTPQRSPENRWATSVLARWANNAVAIVGNGNNMLIPIVLSGPIDRLGIIPRSSA